VAYPLAAVGIKPPGPLRRPQRRGGELLVNLALEAMEWRN
jgi:hypothetical protein